LSEITAYFEEQAEISLAGEAAEVILGKKSPDWKRTGHGDWCDAHANLFCKFDVPFDGDRPPLVAIPEAISRGVQHEFEYEWELVCLHFDFLFRRVSIKLDHAGWRGAVAQGRSSRHWNILTSSPVCAGSEYFVVSIRRKMGAIRKRDATLPDRNLAEFWTTPD